jgi:hypothetical protein
MGIFYLILSFEFQAIYNELEKIKIVSEMAIGGGVLEFWITFET